MLCERTNPLGFVVSVRKIAHVEDDYCLETGGHSANNVVNAIDRHEVLRRHSMGTFPNLGRYRVRCAVLVSQLQVWFPDRLACIHNCRSCCSLTLAAC
jgi:hypothetical protein